MTRAAKITKASNIVSFFLPGLLKDELAIVFFMTSGLLNPLVFSDGSIVV